MKGIGLDFGINIDDLDESEQMEQLIGKKNLVWENNRIVEVDENKGEVVTGVITDRLPDISIEEFVSGVGLKTGQQILESSSKISDVLLGFHDLGVNYVSWNYGDETYLSGFASYPSFNSSLIFFFLFFQFLIESTIINKSSFLVDFKSFFFLINDQHLDIRVYYEYMFFGSNYKNLPSISNFVWFNRDVIFSNCENLELYKVCLKKLNSIFFRNLDDPKDSKDFYIMSFELLSQVQMDLINKDVFDNDKNINFIVDYVMDYNDRYKNNLLWHFSTVGLYNRGFNGYLLKYLENQIINENLYYIICNGEVEIIYDQASKKDLDLVSNIIGLKRNVDMANYNLNQCIGNFVGNYIIHVKVDGGRRFLFKL